MNDKQKQLELRPCAVLGAGDLVSHLHRWQNGDGLAEYQFNVFRLDRHMETTHQLGPNDLRDIVKLSQVIAFAVLDDGWITAELRDELTQLIDTLDEVTQRWNKHHGEQAKT